MLPRRGDHTAHRGIGKPLRGAARRVSVAAMFDALSGANARARARIAAWFCASHALYPEDAIEFRPVRRSAQRMFARMRAKGIIHAVGGDRYWLSLPAFDADTERRRLIAVPIALAVTGTMVAALMAVWLIPR